VNRQPLDPEAEAPHPLNQQVFPEKRPPLASNGLWLDTVVGAACGSQHPFPFERALPTAVDELLNSRVLSQDLHIDESPGVPNSRFSIRSSTTRWASHWFQRF
jgi:hypothetical protein